MRSPSAGKADSSSLGAANKVLGVGSKSTWEICVHRNDNRINTSKALAASAIIALVVYILWASIFSLLNKRK